MPVEFRLFFERSATLSLVLDPQLFVLAATDRFLDACRMRRENTVGQHWFDVLPVPARDGGTGFAAKWRNALEQVVRDRATRTFSFESDEFPGWKADGHRSWKVISEPVMARDGTVQYILVRLEGGLSSGDEPRSSAESDSARRGLYGDSNVGEELAMRTAELNDSLHTMQTFTYTIAHDLRAPLRALISFSTLLSDEFKERLDASGNEYLRRIEAAARQMDRLVNDLLAYGQLTHVDVTAIPISLEHAVNKVLLELEREIRDRQAKVHIARPLPSIIGNTVLVNQVLLNLIDNALKFVPAERMPQIEISATPAEKRVRLRIVDNGIGIPPQYHARVFDLFARLHKSSEYAGTGVGLALVKKAMERMLGRVGIESNPREGCCFWLEFRSPR